MINYDDAEIALKYLVDTDQEYARLKTLFDGLSEQKKSILAIEYGKLTGSAADKTQNALSSVSYQKHLQALRDSQIDYETLKQTRLTKQLIIEMWRSINSARNKGNI